MLMVQTSEYIEDSHHQYELACGCACIYFICKVVYCNKQPFLETSMTINKHDNCGAPRIAAHRTYMGSCRRKMTGSFQILEYTLVWCQAGTF